MSNRHSTDDLSTSGARLRVPRSRGAVSGLLVLVLGAWGALIPLLGPIVDFGNTPNKAWHFSAGRFWLEILPGAVAVVGGLLLLLAADRVLTSLGAWLGVAAGAWFVVGPTLRSVLHLGTTGVPIASSAWGKTLTTLLLFYGIGALILFLAEQALGRLSVISVRDVRAARRRNANADDDKREHRDNDNDNDRDRDDRDDDNDRRVRTAAHDEPVPVVPVVPVSSNTPVQYDADDNAHRTTDDNADDTAHGTTDGGSATDPHRGHGTGATSL